MTHKRAVKLLMSTQPHGPRKNAERLIDECPAHWSNERRLIYRLNRVKECAMVELYGATMGVFACPKEKPEKLARAIEYYKYLNCVRRRCELILNSLGVET